MKLFSTENCVLAKVHDEITSDDDHSTESSSEESSIEETDSWGRIADNSSETSSQDSTSNMSISTNSTDSYENWEESVPPFNAGNPDDISDGINVDISNFSFKNTIYETCWQILLIFVTILTATMMMSLGYYKI